MFKHLSAIRHGRGFGVHSPLAYDLITNVLPDRPAYYGDEDIDKTSSSPRAARLGRILLRLVARFKPAKVCIYRQCDTFAAVVRMADSSVEFSDRQPDMILRRDPAGVLEIVINPGRTGSGTGPLVIDNLRDARIVIHRQGLSRQKINATF